MDFCLQQDSNFNYKHIVNNIFFVHFYTTMFTTGLIYQDLKFSSRLLVCILHALYNDCVLLLRSYIVRVKFWVHSQTKCAHRLRSWFSQWSTRENGENVKWSLKYCKWLVEVAKNKWLKRTKHHSDHLGQVSKSNPIAEFPTCSFAVIRNTRQQLM